MIIVTGGAGFIGSNIINGLNQKGITNILVVDNLGESLKFKNLTSLKIKDYLNKGDFINKVQNGEYKNTPIKAIFHQGACSSTVESDGNYMMKNNYEYSKVLLDFALEKGIPFYYASSASVYGLGENGFEESVGGKPLNVYAYSKFLFDKYVEELLPSVKSPVVGLRYFNVFGPNEIHKGRMSSVVYHFYNQIKTSGKIKLFKGIDGYKDGEQYRDFIYVKDVVKVNLHFFENPHLKGIYNCGTGKAETFNTIAKKIIDVYQTGEIEYIEFPNDLIGKYQNYTESENSKLINEARYNLGFTGIEEAIEDYLNYLIKNDGYI